MGQILSVCATHPSNIDDASHDFIHEDQLPPIGALYIPSNNGLHKFIYDQREDVKIPFHVTQMGHQSDTQNRARSSMLSKDALKLHRPASRYSKSVSPSYEDDRIQITSNLVDVEVESDQESVMTTVSPCKDRSFRSNNRNNSNMPSLQLRLPVQRCLSSVTPTIPSRPSIHRFSSSSSKSTMIVEGIEDGKKSLMREALQQGDIVEVEKLLLTVPAVHVYCWNWPESHGDMILHLAVRLASPLPLLQLLLRYDIGGGPVTPNFDGDTPISLAGKLRHFELLACLMQALQAPYHKSPVSPLRLSTYTYENSPDQISSKEASIISTHLSRSSMSSVSSSLHLSTLFDASNDDNDSKQEIFVDTTADNYQLTNDSNPVIQELLEEIIEEIISLASTRISGPSSSNTAECPSQVEAFLPSFQKSSPCITHMSHGTQTKYAPGRSRSSSLVSESDEWCLRGSVMDTSDEEEYVHRFSAPPPSLSLSSHSYSSNRLPMKELYLSPICQGIASDNNSTSKVFNETVVPGDVSSTVKIKEIAVQHEDENNDDLFFCSPFLSTSKKCISSTTIASLLLSPSNNTSNKKQSTLALSSLSVPQSVVSVPSSTNDICKDEDYGFAELETSHPTVSPVVTVVEGAPCKDNHHSTGVGLGISEGDSVAGTMRRMLVPRPLRKATGRLVRFMLPTLHKHK